MLATLAAVTGQKLDKAQQADSVNMLPAFVGEPEKPIRDHLVLAPNKGTHLSVRKGKWMYIPRQGSGGFTGRKPGDHTFAGPPAVTFVGSVNSDIENGRIKKDAPPAQLYDLESDLAQTKNVYRENPKVVKEMQARLNALRPKKETTENRETPARKRRPGRKRKAAAPSLAPVSSGQRHQTAARLVKMRRSQTLSSSSPPTTAPRRTPSSRVPARCVVTKGPPSKAAWRAHRRQRGTGH